MKTMWNVLALGSSNHHFRIFHHSHSKGISIFYHQMSYYFWFKVSQTFRRRQWHPTPVLLPGKSHRQRSLVGYSPMGSLRVGHNWASSLSLFTFMHWRRKCNPLQCSCLENPRDGGAWWAAIHGVAQSRTRLKRLSSSGSSSSKHFVHYAIFFLFLFLLTSHSYFNVNSVYNV